MRAKPKLKFFREALNPGSNIFDLYILVAFNNISGGYITEHGRR